MALQTKKDGKEIHYTLVSLREKGNLTRRQIQRITVPHPVTGHPVDLTGERLWDYVDLYTGNGPEEKATMAVLSLHNKVGRPVASSGAATVTSAEHWPAWRYLVNWIGAIGCWQLLLGVFDAAARSLTQ